MYTAIKTQSVPPSASVILNWLLKKIMNDKLSLSFNVCTCSIMDYQNNTTCI